MSWDDFERTLCWIALAAASDAWLDRRLLGPQFGFLACDYFLRWPTQ